MNERERERERNRERKKEREREREGEKERERERKREREIERECTRMTCFEESLYNKGRLKNSRLVTSLKIAGKHEAI